MHAVPQAAQLAGALREYLQYARLREAALGSHPTTQPGEECPDADDEDAPELQLPNLSDLQEQHGAVYRMPVPHASILGCVPENARTGISLMPFTPVLGQALGDCCGCMKAGAQDAVL